MWNVPAADWLPRSVVGVVVASDGWLKLARRRPWRDGREPAAQFRTPVAIWVNTSRLYLRCTGVAVSASALDRCCPVFSQLSHRSSPGRNVEW